MMSLAEAESKDPYTAECLWLVKNGIPFDVAFSLDDDTRLAWVVCMAGFEGSDFDWGTKTWRKKEIP